ncbi:MAG TPA: FAD-dependent oxidoreductase [Blastocatellia bacterium]|nr:FAD-dependent oxidoreductase [Blastocatellia bacterium]
MAKPVLLAVDDDPEVLRAVERDLRRQYGNRFRILRANSGDAALDALRQLKERQDPVALLLADQRMPKMTGVEFLEQANRLYPETRRVLLTAYADTEAAIGAINKARVDYYLMKPWDPPEENFYPVLDDLLDDWSASFRPPFEGIRVVGHRWSPQALEVKSFLAGNHVPYQWLDIENDTEASQWLEAETAQKLPLVLFPDGSRLEAPGALQIAERIGLRTRADQPFYDLIIIGGGPAGLAAAVYGASEGLRTVMIERQAPGGQAGTSSRIENYLGFPSGLSGADLARRAVTQARRFGVETLAVEAVGLRCQDSYRFVQLADGSELSSHVVLIATGVAWRKLEVPGTDRLAGAGVYYGAAMTEAFACRDEEVYVVGGANSAGQAAMHLSKFARHVTILARGRSLSATMSQYLIRQISETANITVRCRADVVETHGESHLEAISIVDADSDRRETVPTKSLFIFIGAMPHTDWLAGKIERDQYGFILSGPDLKREGRQPAGWRLEREPFLLETSVPGIFVAGDVRHGSIKRVASSVGEGAIAVQFVHQYLSKL